MSRFRPDGWGELLIRTFEMAKMEGGLYVEVIAPDLRPGALVLMTMIATLGMVWQYRTAHAATASQPYSSRRALVAALISWAVAWGAWLCVSGNGRYAMVLLIFLGPLLGAVVALLPLRNDWRWLVLLLLLACQILLLHGAAPSRGWAMLKQEWGEKPPFPSEDDLIGPFNPDLIIFTQSQTMTALLVNTGSARAARLLSLGYADALGPLSAEALAAKDAVKKAQHPILFEAYPADFISASDLSEILWRRQSQELLGAYGLRTSQENCRRQLSPLNIMQVACKLVKGPPTSRSETISDPAIVRKMDLLINRCSTSLWPKGARFHLPDGGIIQIFRESRYIVKIDHVGAVYVKKRLDINFEKKIEANVDLSAHEIDVCKLIIK